MFSLTAKPIEPNLLIEKIRDERSGALVVFEGWVRDHNQGKKVLSLDYQVYAELAQKEGERILAEALVKFNLHHIECQHRHGQLNLGETAVWVGAVASHREDAFKATRYVIDEVKSRLPIWKKEHYLNEPAQWVSCQDHHHHVHFHESDYYQKQANVVVQSALKKSKVLVVGAGGLGCPVLTALATAGVGNIHIVDFDQVEISNLHRQPLFSAGVIGEKKAVVAQKRLLELNPFIQVQSSVQKLGAENVESLIKDHDLIVDCTDNMATKFVLHDACFKSRIPLVTASIFKSEGQVRTFAPALEMGCLRCTYAETPDDALLGNCNDFGVLGASVAVIGAIQASEALRFLQTGKNTTLADTFFIGLENLAPFKIKNLKKPDCPTCRGEVRREITSDLEIGAHELDANCELVDMREREDAFLDQFTAHHKKIVVYCHRGHRSKSLVSRYRSQGHSHFYSLIGGACSL